MVFCWPSRSSTAMAVARGSSSLNAIRLSLVARPATTPPPTARWTTCWPSRCSDAVTSPGFWPGLPTKQQQPTVAKMNERRKQLAMLSFSLSCLVLFVCLFVCFLLFPFFPAFFSSLNKPLAACHAYLAIRLPKLARVLFVVQTGFFFLSIEWYIYVRTYVCIAKEAWPTEQRRVSTLFIIYVYVFIDVFVCCFLRTAAGTLSGGRREWAWTMALQVATTGGGSGRDTMMTTMTMMCRLRISR